MQQIKFTVHVINFLSRTFVCLGIFEGKCFPSNYQKNYLTRKLLLEKEEINANQILKFICREFIPVKNLVSALYFSYAATRKATLNTHINTYSYE